MHGQFDEQTIRAAFAQPDNDGRFSGAFAGYLAALSANKPTVIFAFPPKAAGTFLRTAAIYAADGQLTRTVHAEGGRDAQFYLPIFLRYYAGMLGEAPLVSHVHMQALPANRRFIEAFDLNPVVMMRAIPDMLRSFGDTMHNERDTDAQGLNCPVPNAFAAYTGQRRADFLVDFVAPWYVGYYATWLEWAQQDPDRICVLRYADFREQPGRELARALTHSGIYKDEADCKISIARAWKERETLRFHRGEAGRGQDFFTPEQHARIARMLSYFPVLDEWRAELLPPRA